MTLIVGLLEYMDDVKNIDGSGAENGAIPKKREKWPPSLLRDVLFRYAVPVNKVLILRRKNLYALMRISFDVYHFFNNAINVQNRI